MIALTVALAVFVGIALGLLGGGGSTLTVPLLAFVAGLDARHAITTALLVVGVTSAVSSVAHARSGRVQWRAALLLGPTGMAGACLGGRLALHVPGSISMVVFAVVMIVSATVLLNDRHNAEATTEPHLPGVKTAVLGISVGVVSGMTGAGGGFLLVAVLALVGGLALPIAVGTSLVIVTMHCAAALVGRLSGEHVDWKLAGMVTAAAVIGSLVGERMTPKIDPRILRTVFGLLVLLMASAVIARETGPTFGPAAAGIVVAIVGLYLLVRRPGADGHLSSPTAELHHEKQDGARDRQPRWVALTQSRKCATAVAVKCPCGEPKKSNACCACGISA